MEVAYLDILKAGDGNTPSALVEIFVISILKGTLSQEICEIRIRGCGKEQRTEFGEEYGIVA